MELAQFSIVNEEMQETTFYDYFGKPETFFLNNSIHSNTSWQDQIDCAGFSCLIATQQV